jgi:hypothetical protein
MKRRNFFQAKATSIQFPEALISRPYLATREAATDTDSYYIASASERHLLRLLFSKQNELITL